jgi:hypothetical protein
LASNKQGTLILHVKYLKQNLIGCCNDDVSPMVEVALVDLTDDAGVGMEQPGTPEGVTLGVGERGKVWDQHNCVFSVAILTCIEKPFLSISVAKPPSTTFTSASMTFPETTVLPPYIRVWRLHVVRLIDCMRYDIHMYAAHIARLSLRRGRTCGIDCER